MAGFGRQTLTTTGYPVEVSADGRPEFKAGGITIDWATVTAVSGSDATLGDNTVVKVGQKAIEYGTILCKITASGKYGPAATSAGGATPAADGRQSIVRGDCVILNETVMEQGQLPGLTSGASDHPGVLVGGRVWKDRLKIGGNGQPTQTQLEAAFPRLLYVQN